MFLSADYGRSIRVEDVEKADEYFYGHDGEEPAEKPAATLPTPQNSLPEAGEKPAATSQASSPAESTPPTNSLPATNLPPTTINPASTEVSSGGAATSTPQATPAPITLEIPAGIQPTPIAAIDEFIRRGYVSRDTLGEIMKHNYKGRTYRREIVQRLALFEARQPPFNDVPVGAVVSGELAGNSLPAVSGENPENTHILAPTPQATPASNPPQATVPEEFVAARNMSDAEALRSLSSNLGAMAFSADFARSIRVGGLDKAGEEVNSQKIDGTSPSSSSLPAALSPHPSSVPAESTAVGGEKVVNDQKLNGNSPSPSSLFQPASSLPATSSPQLTPTQPPSSSIPATSTLVGGEAPVVGGEKAARERGESMVGEGGEGAEITRVLTPSPSPSSVQSTVNPPSSIRVPTVNPPPSTGSDVFKAARNMSDADAPRTEPVC